MYRILGIVLVAAMAALFLWKNDPVSSTVTIQTTPPEANPFGAIKAD